MKTTSKNTKIKTTTKSRHEKNIPFFCGLDEPQQPKEEFTSPPLPPPLPPPNTHKRKTKTKFNIRNSKTIILKKPKKKERRKPTRNKKDKFRNYF
jgi:hypothetical protein